jgi:hypothetical protein
MLLMRMRSDHQRRAYWMTILKGNPSRNRQQKSGREWMAWLLQWVYQSAWLLARQLGWALPYLLE